MPHEPITDLVYIQLDSAAKEQENLAFRGFVKNDLELSDRRLNAVVQETTERVWSSIDCRTCANCCKTQQPVFSRPEVQRIADYLGMTLQDLVVHCLTSDADAGKYITRQCPCPFLENNCCTIYTVRPAVCKNYPHLHRNLRSRLWQLLDNASVCPIVYNVLESLKTRFGFRHMTPETD
jgi:Fe-S-cluster containining protein